MIQELFGGDNSLIAGERKSSINGVGGVLLSPCSLPSSTTSVTTTSTAIAAAANTATTSENQNLRCPRCDSSNTKFCYYNNYNLTQPRHFCKTCRRYWTKGGALRNVPIGGGCRKNKSIVALSSSATKTSSTKMKQVASELGTLGSRSGLGVGFENELPVPSPILWGSPQNTHLMALFGASRIQNQNPNPNPSPGLMSIKEEGNNLMGSQSHMLAHESLVSNGMMLNPRTLGYDTVGHVPSLGLCSSFWRSNNQDQPQQQHGLGFVLGEHQNSSGIQELYQKLKSSSSSGNYCSDNNNLPVFLGNSMVSNILEPSSVSGGELGYWNNPTLSNSWSDLPTTNGAYP